MFARFDPRYRHECRGGEGRQAGLPPVAVFQAGGGGEGFGAMAGRKAAAVAMVGPLLGEGVLEAIGGATGEQDAAARLKIADPVRLHSGYAERGREQHVAANIARLTPAMG